MSLIYISLYLKYDRLFLTIGIRARSTWRCLQLSLIFKSLMVSSILAGGRLGWISSWPRARWRKHYSGGRKSLKTWRKNLARVEWESLDCRSGLLGGRSVGWVFYEENNILVVGSDFKTTIWKSHWRIDWFWSCISFYLCIHEGTSIKSHIA